MEKEFYRELLRSVPLQFEEMAQVVYPMYFMLKTTGESFDEVTTALYRMGFNADAIEEKDFRKEENLFFKLFHTISPYNPESPDPFIIQMQEQGEEIPVLTFKELLALEKKQEMEDIQFVSSYPFEFPALASLPDYRKKGNVCLAAVATNTKNYRYLPEHLRKSEDILLEALRKDGDLLADMRYAQVSNKAYDLAIENGTRALEGFPYNERTMDRCEKAVKKNFYMIHSVPDRIYDDAYRKEYMDRLILPNADQISGYRDMFLLKMFAGYKEQDLIRDFMEKNYDRSIRLIQQENIPTDYFFVGEEYHTPELDKKALLRYPDEFRHIYYMPGRTSADLWLFYKKQFPEKFKEFSEKVPADILYGKNIYSFHLYLERKTKKSYSYEELVDIYNGRPVKFIKKNKTGKITGEQLKVWNQKKHDFSNYSFGKRVTHPVKQKKSKNILK